MKNVLHALSSVGVKDNTLDFIVRMLVIVVTIVIVGCLVIIGIETIKDEPVNTVIISILFVLVTAAAGLITVSHTTSQINGTAAQVANATATTATNAALVQKDAIESVVQAVLSAQRQADIHSEAMSGIASTPQITPLTVEPDTTIPGRKGTL